MFSRKALRSIISTEILYCYMGNNIQDFMCTSGMFLSCSYCRQGKKCACQGQTRGTSSSSIASLHISLGRHVEPIFSRVFPSTYSSHKGWIKDAGSYIFPYSLSCLLMGLLSKPFLSLLMLLASFPGQHFPEVLYPLLKKKTLSLVPLRLVYSFPFCTKEQCTFTVQSQFWGYS